MCKTFEALLEVDPYCLLVDFPDPGLCLSIRPLMIEFIARLPR